MKWGRPSTIFGHSLALATGVALALAVATVVLVAFSPVPFQVPISTYEVAQMLQGQSVLSRRPSPNVTVASQRPSQPRPTSALERVLHSSLARQLNRPEAEVYLAAQGSSWLPMGDRVSLEYERQLVESAGRHLKDLGFSPLMLGAYRAGVRLPDGRWRLVDVPESGPQWHWGIAKLIILGLLLIWPIAWIFSNRLARPIRKFSEVAGRIGRGSFERVAVQGPTEIQLAASALNDMQDRLQRYLNERTSMIGAIAHDLRTPLSRLAFLLSAAPTELREKTQEQLSEMDRMIGSTLDFVRSEAAPLQLDTLDLRMLLEGIVDDFSDRGAEAFLTDGSAVVVNADALMLRRLFTNLVANALAYGGSARVSMYLEGEDAVVNVVDQGPGLTQIELDRVFEPFFRAEPSRNRSTGGTGLGLTIVQAVARAHGGSVSLANQPGGGLCARVTLPISGRRDDAT